MLPGTVFDGHSRWISATVLLLEIVIAVYVIALLTFALTGGFAFGWASVTRGEKLILVLLLAIPARMAIPVPLQVGPLLGPRKAWLDRLMGGRAMPIVVSPAVQDVAITLLILRPAAFGLAFLAKLVVPARGFRTFSGPFAHDKLFEIFAAWDSGWYFDIAKRGYYFIPGRQSSIAFFPLYPMTMRIVAWPFGSSDRAIWLAGIAVAWTSFAAALFVLHRFTDRYLGSRETARRTVMYLAVFPFSLFFTRVYAESLFLLVTLLAIDAAHRGRWWWAGLWGALAALTRPNGILIAIPLLLLAIRGRPSPRELGRRSSALTLVPLGTAGYCLFVLWLTGNPLAWLDAQQHWSYSLGHAPWEQLLKLIHGLLKHGPYGYFLTSRLASYQFMHGIVAILFLALTPAVFRYLGLALGSYVLVSLLVPLSGSDLQGLGRYASVLFPVFMVMGHRSGALHEAILIISSLYRALLTGLFVTLHPIY